MKPSVRITNVWGKWAHVLPEFIEVCPDYRKRSMYGLWTDYCMDDYLHNVDGPSLISVSPMSYGDDIYAIEGIVMPKDKWEHEAHAYKFRSKLEELL